MKKRARRYAPGRRIILLYAKDKKEALAAIDLLRKQVEENCPDTNNRVVQSLYTSNGAAWFG